jgi:hypothetical protein
MGVPLTNWKICEKHAYELMEASKNSSATRFVELVLAIQLLVMEYLEGDEC